MNEIENINYSIKENEVRKVIIDYFNNNPQAINTIKSGMLMDSNINLSCRYYLIYYESKICWKFDFSIGGSYIIVDANNAEIIDTYFHNGIIVNVD